jgi:hypothetical protein
MGASTFETVSEGSTAQAAFNKAVKAAQHECGHGGYTGTIAEKRSFVMIECPQGTDHRTFINKLIDDGDPRIDDKWGPAGCIKLSPKKYVFFGWASD